MLTGVVVTTSTWLAAILAGVSAPNVAVSSADGSGSLLVLGLVTAALGIPGALVVGWFTAREQAVGRFVRGYVAAATGGLLATFLVFIGYQVGRGAVPALQQGSPGAALYAVFVAGLALGFLAVTIVVTSILAAPFALIAAWLEPRVSV